jgi:ABC-type sugar transport system, ATPase component
MTRPILEMRKICKRFPGVVALDDVDLAVFPGEVVALAGENGAGKSTLMNVLGGVLQSDGGDIFIDHVETPIRSASEATQHGISFVHQELNILDNLTVAENVYLGREPRQFKFLVDRHKLNADTDSFLRQIGLGISSRTSVSQLSIAQQQLIEIAKALSVKARIVIMDEPTSSLTLTETAHLLGVIRDLRSSGVAVIYISHRLAEIERIADRVVVLRDGKNVGTLEGNKIRHENIVKLMVGRDIDRFYKPASARDAKPVAEIRNLRTSRYPNSVVSFDVRKGEILGFAGLVGAGRSEVAQAIFGVGGPVSANFSLDGQPVNIRSCRNAIDNGIYLVPEDRRVTGLIVDMSIRENITLPALKRYASAGLISRALESRTASEMCKRLNVKAPSTETSAASLSGGNQQKVVLAKWLSLKPQLLIFDEPTRGIDVGAKAEIYEIMRGLAASGVAIMMISSDMEEILGESDRIAVMHEGVIAGILERDEANEEAIMSLAVGK